MVNPILSLDELHSFELSTAVEADVVLFPHAPPHRQLAFPGSSIDNHMILFPTQVTGNDVYFLYHLYPAQDSNLQNSASKADTYTNSVNRA